MLPIYREDDCPQTPLEGWCVGILGYGNQGRAHALNLRDSGYRTLVGASSERASAKRAREDGFDIIVPERLLNECDLIALLAPDELHRELVAGLYRALGSDRPRTQAWVLAHGFALHFDPPPYGSDCDVFVVAPASPGVQVRDRYVDGAGVPALLAVGQDASGQAEARARAYAAAIGAARAGVFPTTVREEVEVDLFGEQAVLCGGLNALLTSAFETLVEGGYAPEMAYVECVQQVRLTAELVERYGIEGMRRRISRTALYGDLSRGPRLVDRSVREELKRVLGEVRDGSFAKEWIELQKNTEDSVEARLDGATNSELERTGTTIRRVFGHGE